MSIRKKQELIKEYERKAAGEECTCPAADCPVRGNCRVCLAWHRDYGKQSLPQCVRGKASGPASA